MAAEFVWRVASPAGVEFEVVLAPPGSALDVGSGGPWAPPPLRDGIDRILWPLGLVGLVVRGLRRAWKITGPKWRVVARSVETLTTFRRPAYHEEHFDDEVAARTRASEICAAIAAGTWRG